MQLRAVEPAFDEEAARRRGYGSFEGQFEVTDIFFEPMPEDDPKRWGDGAK